MKKTDRISVGARVSISPRGKKGLWCAEFSLDGKHKRVALKTPNKKVALERATDLEHRLDLGNYASAPPPVALRDVTEAYLKFLKTEGRARRTLTRYRGELEAFAAFVEQQHVTRIHQVKMATLDGYRAHRREDHEQTTVCHETIVIKQLFKWACKRGLMPANPISGYEVRKPPRKHKDVLTLPQVNMILGGCTARRRAEIGTLAFTGMRAGELQGLRSDGVDRQSGWILIAGQVEGPTKTGQVRRVPIHPRLQKLLQAQPAGTGGWFCEAEPSSKYPAGGHPINTKRLCEYFKAVAARVGINGFTLHSLRHFFKTHAINHSVPERAVDLWLGHSDGSVRGLYYHLTDEESKRFMDNLPLGEDFPPANTTEETDNA